MRYTILLLVTIILVGCTHQKEEQILPRSEIWRATLVSGGGELPFNFDLNISGDSIHSITIINGKEKISLEDIQVRNDSLRLRFPVFDSEIIAKIYGDTVMEGYWYDHARANNYRILFKAIAGLDYRFEASDTGNFDLSGDWQATFSPATIDSTPAIARFQQSGSRISATFLTPTGDYRYLEGLVKKDSLYLSTFDGAHAYLITAKLGDTLEGMFYSGNHYQEQWIAFRNPDFKLPDPDSLTFLKEGYDRISLTFPDADSNLISTNDPRFQNKILIIQLMGTWCPNCKDETTFLADYYQKYREEGLEILGLAFEKTDDFQTAARNIKRLQKNFNIDYPVLIAGNNKKDKASEKLPMLNKVVAFPTLIFIDRNGNVRRIHTGFNGPATGELYYEFVKEFEAFVGKLLQE